MTKFFAITNRVTPPIQPKVLLFTTSLTMTSNNDDEETGVHDHGQKEGENPEETAEKSTSSSAPSTKSASSKGFLTAATTSTFLAFILSRAWGATMTALYVKEINKDPTCGSTAFRSLDGENQLGVGAISHLNVVVNDSVDTGAAYYRDIFGFEPASNADGPMDYRAIDNFGFCVDAGFDEGDCLVDILFLKHPIIGIYLELFYYYQPVGNLNITIKATNDAGGIRHVALEVENAVDTFRKLQAKDHQGTFLTQQEPIELTPFP